MTYTKHFSKTQTSQSDKIPGSEQVANSAGGFSFQVNDFDRLQRFLVLGSEGGSYYASEKKLTVENGTTIEKCLDADYKRTIDLIVEISTEGRAPKNDPALFALAVAAGHKNVAARTYALSKLPEVARIGTHLFTFAGNIEHFRGWGKALRKAVGRWYAQPAKKLALQAVKYQQRNGWSHRDLLRLSHPVPTTPEHQALFGYITKGLTKELEDVSTVPENLQLIWAHEKAKTTEDPKEVIKLITDYRLPHECVPNEFKKDREVWAALLQNMPVGAMVRNLGRMSSIGLLTPVSDAAKLVSERLRDQERIQRARLHPFSVLVAQMTYGRGAGTKGSLTWNPVNAVQDALEDAFYLSFKNVKPTGKPTLIGLDVSGSMGGMWGMGGGMMGVPGLTPRVASACMCLVTARVEPQYQIMGFSDTFIDLKITAKDTLQSAIQKTSGLPFRGTDCALPMLYALQNKLAFENFIVYTDSETWAGHIHPSQALAKVRSEMNVPAKLAVVGMVANDFTIADPEDVGMLDFVGFDTAAPALMADFFRE